MKLLAAVLAVTLCASPAVAAGVSLPVTLRDGAAWTIESVRIREDQRKDGPRRIETRSTYRAVYRTSKTGGRLTLTPTAGSILGELPAGVETKDFLFPLELEVDESLTPERLVNWPQVRTAAYKMLGDVNPKVLEAMRGMLEQLPDDRAGAVFLPQITLLGMGQGLNLEPGKPLTYDDILPNPLGGPPIKAVGVFTLGERDATRKETAVSWTQTLDKDSMAESMKTTMTALIARMAPEADPAKAEAALSGMTMSRDSNCRFAIDDATGLARRTDCVTLIAIKSPGEDGRRTDTWTITQSLPEYR